MYPQKACGDAPYTVDEATLRAAIHIPPGFTFGAKPPVILMPGTGTTGFETFQGNFIPALKGQSYADAVWLNIPGSLLDDSQTNSEYIAYAINYISGITSRNVSVIAWSQGNINSQWAYKYVSKLISVDGSSNNRAQILAICSQGYDISHRHLTGLCRHDDGPNHLSFGPALRPQCPPAAISRSLELHHHLAI